MNLDLSPLADMVASRVLTAGLADEVLTVKQAARLLQLSESTVRLYASSGQLPGRKFGDSWRFRKSALLDSITPISPTIPQAAD